MEFTVENLEEAVAVFYRAEPNYQAQAHQWLSKAQNSVQAWSFVWELLDPQRVSNLKCPNFVMELTINFNRIFKYNFLPPQPCTPN